MGKKTPPFDPYADVGKAQDLAMKGVEGYGAALKPHLMREIGNALGGLNSIGALRSGGSEQALTDISTDYEQQIGNYAAQASGQALGYGLEAGKMRAADQQRRDAKKAAVWKAVGSVLGAGVGFVASGFNPAGAIAGAKLGSSVAPGGGYSNDDPTYGGSYFPGGG